MLDTVGVLAKTAAELLVVARVLVENDAGPPPGRVGVPSLALVADGPARHAVSVRVAELRGLGIEVVDLELDLDLALLRRRGLLLCEREAAEYWGSALDGSPAGLSDQVRDLLRFGRAANPDAIDQARAVRADVEAQVRAAFHGVELANILLHVAIHSL